MLCLNNPVADYKGYNYPEPLRSYIAEFERQMLGRRVHRHTPRAFSRSLWNFFSRFPSRHDPRKIYVTDVEDWREIRLAQGAAWNTVRKELGHVGTFFNWLIREKGVEMANPVIWLAPQIRRLPAEKLSQPG